MKRLRTENRQTSASRPGLTSPVFATPHEAPRYLKAMLARDARFDGVFFVAVASTGIYCRPVCSARPHARNVRFYRSAIDAESAGYRPCLRCRPEAAPLSAAWQGRSAVVQRALRLISEGGHGLIDERFAARFGMCDRHLRRLFQTELGQTPKQIADAGRLDFARALVVETTLAMTAISETSGFSSLRRFNDAFQRRFHRAPSALRRTASLGGERADAGFSLTLAYRPPLDWNGLLEFHRRHTLGALESVAGDGFERVFVFEGTVKLAKISPIPSSNRLRLEVSGHDPRALYPAVRAVRRMFDLDADPLKIAESFATSAALRRLERRRPGLRVPSGWDPFESAVAVVLGQLVSVAQANRLIAQLIESEGEITKHPVTGHELRLFPSPERLASSPLAGVRTTQARKRALRDLARAVADGTLDFSAAHEIESLRERLLMIRGLGPWSAEMILMRSLGHADAFPAGDLILKRAIEGMQVDLESVRPWRSYLAQHLWNATATSQPKGKT